MLIPYLNLSQKKADDIIIVLYSNRKSKYKLQGQNIINNLIQKFMNQIINLHKKQLSEFADQYSESIGREIDKIKNNVIMQNKGVALDCYKSYNDFKMDAKKEIENILKEKSLIYSIRNFAKKLYEKLTLKFKVSFREQINEMIENENSVK